MSLIIQIDFIKEKKGLFFFSGISIANLPERYLPVKLSSEFSISSIFLKSEPLQGAFPDLAGGRLRLLGLDLTYLFNPRYKRDSILF